MKNSRKVLLTTTLLLAASGSMNLALGAGEGATGFAESAGRLAQQTKDKESTKWITGKTFRGIIKMTVPSTGVWKNLKSVFTGPESKEQPFKLEFRGTILDKLNPFRKPSYWKIYLKGLDNREAVVSGDLEYEVKNGILILSLYHDKKLALKCSEPMKDVESSSKINVSPSTKGTIFVPESGNALSAAVGIDVSENTKSALEQLKLKLERSEASSVLQDQIMKSIGQ